ncbi:MAG: hypothetical protein AB7V45_15380 [Candidatus Krumholzibacteriia bacterium]
MTRMPFPHARIGRHCCALSLILLVAAAGGGRGLAQEPETLLAAVTGDTLFLPGQGRITGVAWVGPDTLAFLEDVPDTVSGSGRREVRLVFQDRSGAILLEEDFTGVLDRTLAYDGEYLWSCGDVADGSSLIYKLRVDTLQVEGAFDLPGHRPVGMCFDGSHLWVSDRDSGRLDRFDPETEAVTRTVVSPGFSPCGLAWDGRSMWSTDSGTGLLYRLSGSRNSWSATVAPGAFLHRGEDILLLHDGFSMWYIPENKQLAVRMNFQ